MEENKNVATILYDLKNWYKKCSVCNAKIPTIVGLEKIDINDINYCYNCGSKFIKKI